MQLKKYIKSNKLMYKILYPIVNVIRRVWGINVKTFLFYTQFIIKKIGFFRNQSFIKLKNTCKGKIAFVVATGPSLKESDLEWLEKNDIDTFSVNSIFRVYDRVKWRPTYYVLDDYYAYLSYMEKFKEVDFYNICKKDIFFSQGMKKYVKNKYPIEKAHFIPFCYYDHWFTNSSQKFNFNENMEYGYFDLYTVTNFAICIAKYMGYQEVYLLGVDCNYMGGNLHIGEEENQDERKEMESLQDAQFNSYKYLNECIKECEGKFKVYNATRGGRLEVFERKNMDEIISSSNKQE